MRFDPRSLGLGALLLTAVALALPTGCSRGDASGEIPRPLSEEQRITALIEELRDVKKRDGAKDELVSLGEKILPQVVARMRDGDPVIRWELANLQGRLKDPRALPLLASNVLSDPDVRVRERSMWAVAEYDNPAMAVDHYKSNLGSADEETRWRAAVALAYLERAEGIGELHAGLSSAQRSTQAVRALDRLFKPHSGHGPENPVVREHGEATAAALVTAFPTLDAMDRCQVALLLGKLPVPAAVTGLRTAMHDASADVRWRACMSLVRVGDLELVPELEALLASETDEKVRKQAELAITRLTSNARRQGITRRGASTPVETVEVPDDPEIEVPDAPEPAEPQEPEQGSPPTPEGEPESPEPGAVAPEEAPEEPAPEPAPATPESEPEPPSTPQDPAEPPEQPNV